MKFFRHLHYFILLIFQLILVQQALAQTTTSRISGGVVYSGLTEPSTVNNDKVYTQRKVVVRRP